MVSECSIINTHVADITHQRKMVFTLLGHYASTWSRVCLLKWREAKEIWDGKLKEWRIVIATNFVMLIEVMENFFIQGKTSLWFWLKRNEKVEAKYVWAGLVARWGIIRKLATGFVIANKNGMREKRWKRGWGGGRRVFLRRVEFSLFIFFILHISYGLSLTIVAHFCTTTRRAAYFERICYWLSGLLYLYKRLT